MANWSDMGHAMRRRIGAPSSSLDAIGAAATQTHPTLDDHYEAAKSANSSRVALGDGPIDTPHETMSPEQNAPANMSKAGGTAPAERNGAAYRVTASVPVMADPSVGPTVANGRILRNAVGTSDSFYSAANDSLA